MSDDTAAEAEPVIHLHEGDLPPDAIADDVQAIAVDTETMGLNPHRDRLCLVQLSAGDGVCHLVRFAPGDYHAPNLQALLDDPRRLKIFHFARFDIAVLRHYLDVVPAPLYCTKLASRLCRTYTPEHGLRHLCADLLGVELSKTRQTTDWGRPELAREQLFYAARDVLYLHRLRGELDAMLHREGRGGLAQACFDFLPTRAELDLAGWGEIDIFAHH